MNDIDRISLTGSPFDAIMRVNSSGKEYWSARDLMPLLGYTEWRNFEGAIDRACVAASNSGVDTKLAFAHVTQLVGAANLGDQRRSDFYLSRYGAYLTAMNGDPRKPEIAAAQTYFAVKTREAETTRTALPQSYADALRELAATVEAKQAAEERIAQLEPSAQAWDTLATATGDYDVARAAQILSRDPAIKTGRDRLFTHMAKFGWVYRAPENNRWRVYQAQIDLGRMMILPSSHYHPRTGELVLDIPQVRITVKGLRELHRRLGGTAPFTVDEYTGAENG